VVGIPDGRADGWALDAWSERLVHMSVLT
jgi:hypothetical protein